MISGENSRIASPGHLDRKPIANWTSDPGAEVHLHPRLPSPKWRERTGSRALARVTAHTAPALPRPLDTHLRELAHTCAAREPPGRSPRPPYLSSPSRPTSMGPSDSLSEPLGCLGRFMASAGCRGSGGCEPGSRAPPRPRPGAPPPPFPRALPAPQPGAPRPRAPAGTHRPGRGKAPGGRRPHRRREGRLRSTAWPPGRRALGGLGQVPLEAPPGSLGSLSVPGLPRRGRPVKAPLHHAPASAGSASWGSGGSRHVRFGEGGEAGGGGCGLIFDKNPLAASPIGVRSKWNGAWGWGPGNCQT